MCTMHYCKLLCVCRLIEVEPLLKQLHHYFQVKPSVELEDQCFTFMTTLDNIVNMIRCADCLNEKKKSLAAIRESLEITKEHCIVSIDDIV